MPPIQVLDLLEAVEGLKAGIMNGDGVALDKVEQAVGKVARGIDVYLILAVGAAARSMILCIASAKERGFARV
ncbi:MAG: hypothetical protein ABJP39_14360, partial [Marinobacter alexandrii]|uniref:hypothetical protein n=1 Tax=Marinobacter alexandrii TaxID=2570351 RepID=UPI00329A75A5